MAKAKKRPRSYWQTRFLEMEKASHAYGLETYAKIEPAFMRAQRDINREIERWYGRFAINNKMSPVNLADAKKLLNSDELKELKWDLGEYIIKGRDNAQSGQWEKELENASAKYHISRLEALQLRTQQAIETAFGNELDAIDLMARHVITDSYYHTLFEVEKGFNIGYGIGQLNEGVLNRLIAKPWAADGKDFSDRVWERKSTMVGQLHQELVRTLVQGKAPDAAIKQLEQFVGKKVKNARYAAQRLVMTEQAYFHSAAQKEAFKALDVEEYEVIATLDHLTSETCQELDGRHYPMKDFAAGITAPPFHPNCRCVTAPYFPDNFGGERWARDSKTGKGYYVPDNMTYKEWWEEREAAITPTGSGDIPPAAPASVTSVAAVEVAPTEGEGKYRSEGIPEKGLTNSGNGDIIKETPRKRFATFVDNQAGFTDDFRNKLKVAFANGTPAAREAYLKYLTPDAIGSTTHTGNRFRPGEGKVYLNVQSLMADPRGATTSFFHEFGHLVDYKSQNGSAWTSIDNPAYIKAIHKDFDDMIQGVMKANKCTQKTAYVYISREIKKQPNLANQISDLFGGLSKNQISNGWKHDVDYWNDSSLVCEAFAHMFECQFDSKRYDLMQKYFPTALAEFEKMLGGIV